MYDGAEDPNEDTITVLQCFISANITKFQFRANIDANISGMMKSLEPYKNHSTKVFQTIANLLAKKNYDNLQDLTIKFLQQATHTSWEIQTSCGDYIFYYNLNTKQALLHLVTETLVIDEENMLERELQQTFLTQGNDTKITIMIKEQLTASIQQLKEKKSKQSHASFRPM